MQLRDRCQLIVYPLQYPVIAVEDLPIKKISHARRYLEAQVQCQVWQFVTFWVSQSMAGKFSIQVEAVARLRIDNEEFLSS